MNKKKSETKRWCNWLVLIIGMVCLLILGCQPLFDSATPLYVPKEASTYVGEDPNDYWFGFTSLLHGREMLNDIIIKHRNEQKSLLRKAEDDTYNSKNAKGFIEAEIKRSEDWQGWVVGSASQPVSILGLLAGAGIAFPVGKMLKRKGDYTPEEHETEVQKAKEAVKKELNGNNV